MKEFLSQRGVDYVLRDVTTDRSALDEFVRLSVPLPPVVMYKGAWVAGYDPERLDELLGDIS